MAIANSQLHKDVPLTGYVQAWKPPQTDWFMREKIFPLLTVDKATNIYRVIDQGTMMQVVDANVGANGRVKEVDFGIGSDGQYRCVPRALEGRIDHYERKQADDQIQYEQRKTDIPMLVLTNTLEKVALVDTLRPTANLGTSYKTLDPTGELFDDYGSGDSDPINEFLVACDRIMTVIGHKPNTVVIDRLVWRAISQHPAVLNRVLGGATTSALARITIKQFEQLLEDVLEPGSINVTRFRYNNVTEPGTKTNISAIGPDISISFTEPPSMDSVGAAHEFSFVGEGDDEPIGVYTFEDPKQGVDGSTIVRVRKSCDFKLAKLDAMYVLKDCVDVADAKYASQLVSVA